MAPHIDINELTIASTNLTMDDRTTDSLDKHGDATDRKTDGDPARRADAVNIASISVTVEQNPASSTLAKNMAMKSTSGFTYHDSLSYLNISAKDYLDANRDTHVLATGVAVFGQSVDGQDHLLLVQRSPTDSYPNRWEIPGGSVDLTGETILEAAARELKEETGLTANHFVTELWKTRFSTGRGVRTRWWTKFSLMADVAEMGNNDELVSQVDKIGAAVKLDENEHQAWLWASEEDIQNLKCGSTILNLVNDRQKNTMLNAFAHRKASRSPQEASEPVAGDAKP